jgi:hypothetical protein
MPETHDLDRRIGTLSDICTPGFVCLDMPDGPLPIEGMPI